MSSETGSLAVDLPVFGRLPWYQRGLVEKLIKLQLGFLQISLPGQPPFRIQGAAPGRSADIRVRRPGRRVALQVITIDEAQFDQYAENPGGFVHSSIFPGGMLPTKSHLQRLVADAGLKWRVMEGLGTDCADTLAFWHQRLKRCTRWQEAHGDDRWFRRMWRCYLAFCEAGFRARRIDVVHCLMARD